MRDRVLRRSPRCAVGSALVVVSSHRNPVVSALAWRDPGARSPVFFLLLDAQFLARLQIMVYAGAIVVLFLFVIMLLNLARAGARWRVGRDPAVPRRRCSRGVAVLAGHGPCALRGRWTRSPRPSPERFGCVAGAGRRALHRLPAAVRGDLAAAAGGDGRRRAPGEAGRAMTVASSRREAPSADPLRLRAPGRRVLFAIGVVGVLTAPQRHRRSSCRRADAERRQPGASSPTRAPARRRRAARSSSSSSWTVAAAEAAVGPRDRHRALPPARHDRRRTSEPAALVSGSSVLDLLWLDPAAAARSASRSNGRRRRCRSAARRALRRVVALARRRSARCASLAASRSGDCATSCSATARSARRASLGDWTRPRSIDIGLPARPALGGDAPRRHRRRLPDPRLLASATWRTRPASSASSST